MQIPESEILELIDRLENSKSINHLYLSSIRHSLINYKDGDIVFFMHNLGGGVNNFQGDINMYLKSIYDCMYESSETWRNYMIDKRFIIELYVFSGQMDFTVSRWENGVLTEY
jgi:hypothetical protein